MGYRILAPFYVSFALFDICMMLILMILKNEQGQIIHTPPLALQNNNFHPQSFLTQCGKKN